MVVLTTGLTVVCVNDRLDCSACDSGNGGSFDRSRRARTITISSLTSYSKELFVANTRSNIAMCASLIICRFVIVLIAFSSFSIASSCSLRAASDS